MKKIIVPFFSLLFVALFAYSIGRISAQTVSPPITIQSTVPHTSCVVPPAGTSAYCFASDGLWQSINGATYVQLPSVAGVSSVTVCNAGGTSCGIALTGAVKVNVPSTASTTLQ